MSLVLLILLGGITGLASGYLGIGGGIILVPVLRELFRAEGMNLDQVMTAAFATSLFTAIFTTGSSAWRQWRQDNLIMSVVPWTAAGALIGGQVGAYFGSNLSGGMLQSIFAGFLILSGINIAGDLLGTGRLKRTESDGVVSSHRGGLILLGLTTGIIGALLGVGGGIVMVPAFIFLFRFPSGRVAGTSSAVAFLLTISGVIGYLLYGGERAVGTDFFGVIDLKIAVPIIVGTLATAQVGAWMNKRFGGRIYRRIFGLFLIFVGLRMFLGA